MNIEEFHEALTQKEKDEVLEALSKLTEISEPEEVSEVHLAALYCWSGWR